MWKIALSHTHALRHAHMLAHLHNVQRSALPDHFKNFGSILPLFMIYKYRLNILAELLRFGDREFYKDWWNAKTVEEVSSRSPKLFSWAIFLSMLWWTSMWTICVFCMDFPFYGCHQYWRMWNMVRFILLIICFFP